MIRAILLFSLLTSVFPVQVAMKAQQSFKEALEFNSVGDYPSAISKYIDAYNVDQGVLGLEDEGILKNATAYFEQYLTNNPQDLNSLMWLGTIETLRGDLKRAIGHYEKVVLFAAGSPEGLEADREILRLENLLKKDQKVKEQEVEKKQEKAEDLQRIKENVTREVEEQYKAQIGQLKQEIDTLQAEKARIQKEAEAAKQMESQLREEISKLREQNDHHRRMYLFYRRKAKD